MLAVATSAHAASTVYFSVQYQSNIVLNRSFDLPNPGTITLTDDTGVSRTIDAQSVLAVLSDIQSTTTAYKITGLHYYSSFGALYLACMQVPAYTNSACNNWQYHVNNVYPDDGMDQHKLSGGETVYIHFGDAYSQVSPGAFTAFSPGPTGGGLAGTSLVSAPVAQPAHIQFNTDKAIEFLTRNQNKDGSLGNAPMFSDWAAVALGSFQGEASAKTKLKDYLLANPYPGNLLTDYERRAMALMALGINPYSGTSANYIQKILGSFDGEQFGGKDLINDDIFALLTLIPAGYRNSDKEISQDIAFLLQNQKSNGSWGDVDLTASAVQALSQVATTNDVKDALGKAKAFLAAHQEDSGGFGNVYSTSWATQAIFALKENSNSWIKNGHTPQDYLQFQQASDGGVQQSDTSDNRIWATSYAIPAALGKDWGSILNYFSKQQVVSAKIAEPEKVTVLVQTNENENLKALLQKIDELSEKIALAKNQLALAETLNTIQQKVKVIAIETQELTRQIALIEKPQASKVFAASTNTSPVDQGTPYSASPVQQQVIYGASVANAAPSMPSALFIIFAATGIFLLLGGWNFVAEFARGKMGA